MKKLTCLLLVLAIGAGWLLGAGAVEPSLKTEQADPEPWIVLTGEQDPAGAASVKGAVPYITDDAPAPTEPQTLPAIGSGAEGDARYLNDGGRYPVRAMVSFMDDDCRYETYHLLYKEVIEPLGIPYTLALPLDKLDTEGYIGTAELYEMLGQGVSISCHTMTETGMTEHSVWELDEMLQQWKETAGMLDCGEVLSYAYCNGIWSDELITAVKSHFRMGFTVEPGINRIPYESFYMKRVGLFSNKSEAVAITVRDGYYLNALGTLMRSTPGQRQVSQSIPVRAGEVYEVTCSAIWGGCCYVIRDAAGNILEQYNVPDTAQGQLLLNHEVSIPDGAATMTLSHNTLNYGAVAMGAWKVPAGTTLAAAKAYVDQVAREGGWLVFMTHAWYSGFSTAQLIELVEYIQAAGIPIVDVNDAIRLTGNVIEVGTFRKPLEYAASPYFVVSSDGQVYTNGLEIPDVPENYESVRLTLSEGQVLMNGRRAAASEPAYVVSDTVDIRDCEAVLVSGWAYAYSPQSRKGYQLYIITDENGTVLKSQSAVLSYADGGDTLDHQYIELPEGAAYITIAGNIYHTRPELTKIHSVDG